jgi:SEC-C motif/Protein of unknown function (DUF2384)
MPTAVRAANRTDLIMTAKIGRNDPCPCSSGAKYKHCHGRPASTAPAAAGEDGHAGAVEMALAWLAQRHRKALQAAFDDLLFEVLWPEGGPEPADVDQDAWRMIMTNLGEWLLAEGDIEVKGQWREVNEYLLSPGGPALSAGQQRWIAQLAEQPLRLYTVTQVRRGEGLTLADALDTEAPPLLVQERMGSESARPGMLIGCRVMSIGDHLELSGAIYPFSVLVEPGALAAARSELAAQHHPEDHAYMVGLAIARRWVQQMVGPPAIPAMVDASSGEPLLLINDHYQVLDAQALTLALERRPDVTANPAGGWHREHKGADDLTRVLAAVNPGKQPGRIEVFYRTQMLADEGRAWFESVAGEAVRHLTREISDPRGVLSKAGADSSAATAPVHLPPEALAEAIEKVLLRSYANWTDEPIPALGGKTPRQAIESPGGLERVKGLLRSYEDAEAERARTQGRRSISYQFLWDGLGISR